MTTAEQLQSTPDDPKRHPAGLLWQAIVEGQRSSGKITEYKGVAITKRYKASHILAGPVLAVGSLSAAVRCIDVQRRREVDRQVPELAAAWPLWNRSFGIY